MTVEKREDYHVIAMKFHDDFNITDRLQLPKKDLGRTISRKQLDRWLMDNDLVAYHEDDAGERKANRNDLNVAGATVRKEIIKAQAETQYVNSHCLPFALDVGKKGEVYTVCNYSDWVDERLENVHVKRQNRFKREGKQLMQDVERVAAIGEMTPLMEHRKTTTKLATEMFVDLAGAMHNTVKKQFKAFADALKAIEMPPTPLLEGQGVSPPPGDGEGQEESRDTDPFFADQTTHEESEEPPETPEAV